VLQYAVYSVIFSVRFLYKFAIEKISQNGSVQVKRHERQPSVYSLLSIT